MSNLSARELLRRFPNASKSTLQANYGEVDPVSVRPTVKASEPEVRIYALTQIVIEGQIRGGKNNMIVTTKGKHVPEKKWAKWRDQAVAQVKSQLPSNWEALRNPTRVRIEYVAGDHRRRDFPAICDALWHVLERAGVVEDDTLLWPAESSRAYSKENPRTVITFL